MYLNVKYSTQTIMMTMEILISTSQLQSWICLRVVWFVPSCHSKASWEFVWNFPFLSSSGKVIKHVRAPISCFACVLCVAVSTRPTKTHQKLSTWTCTLDHCSVQPGWFGNMGDELLPSSIVIIISYPIPKELLSQWFSFSQGGTC